MNKTRRLRPLLLAGMLILLALTALLWRELTPPPVAESAFSIQNLLAAPESGEFRRVLKPEPLLFPRDHGPHPDFQSEWWYLTGHLETAQGAGFGYQFTLFRHGLSARPATRTSAWAANQIYMAHLALTDIDGGKFYSFERFSRGEPGLAGATAAPWRFWLESWRVVQTDSMPLRLHLQAAEEEITLDLQLENLKPFVLQGDQGFSRKGPEAGQASFYYSLPRMAAAGEIRIGAQRHAVTGQSWMDREWGTTQLSPHLAGWDWFSLQLEDGREVMYYQLRHHDGSADSLSRGVLIAADGQSRTLKRRDIELQVTGHWTSSSGSRYPGRWRLVLPGEGLELEIEPVLADQEWRHSIRYWEGAVRVSGRTMADAKAASGAVASGETVSGKTAGGAVTSGAVASGETVSGETAGGKAAGGDKNARRQGPAASGTPASVGKSNTGRLSGRGYVEMTGY